MFRSHADEGTGEKLSSARKWLILIGAALGVALLIFGSTEIPRDDQKTESAHYDPTQDELVLYQSFLEERVRSICESVSGVGGVTAIVTLSGGFESVYATEWNDGNEEYVIIGSGSNASALFLTRDAPEIAGIGVVCHGSVGISTKNELTALLSAAFRVPSNRIYISG